MSTSTAMLPFVKRGAAHDEPPRTWQQELPRFLATLDNRRTRHEYGRAIARFFETPGVPEELGALSYDVLLAYRGSLALRAESGRRCLDSKRGDHLPTTEFHKPPTGGLAPATVNIRLTALRGFLAWCRLWGHVEQLDGDKLRACLKPLKVERRRPYQVLAQPEWAAFQDAAMTGVHGQRVTRSKAGLTGARTCERDHALVVLLLATGLRVSEVCALDVGDVQQDADGQWWLVLPDAKTKGQRGGRTLPLANAVAMVLLEYVRKSGRRFAWTQDRATPLFLSQYRRGNRRLSPSMVRYVLDRVEATWRAAGASRGACADGRSISTHSLRHSAAVALLEGNEQTGRPPASVEHVRGWLGHVDIRTTAGYLDHLDARKSRRRFMLSAPHGKGE